jgi:hypothetical protein
MRLPGALDRDRGKAMSRVMLPLAAPHNIRDTPGSPAGKCAWPAARRLLIAEMTDKLKQVA